MGVFLPLIYVLAGVAFGRFLPDLRGFLAKLLTKVCIPYVIIYSLLTYQIDAALLTGFGFVFCSLLFLTGQVLSKDRLTALAFSYLNVGWLGLPLAIAVFGDVASRIIIAIYIGNSVFGNIVSVAALQPHANWRVIAKRTLLAPTVLAVFAGLILRWVPFDLTGIDMVQAGDALAKQSMSIAGMCVLGIWLYGSRITLSSLRAALPITLGRAVAGSIIVGIFALVCRALNVQFIMTHAVVLFILPLLPPAANIVVLETYYRGTGQSAPIIASGTLISLILLLFYISWAFLR